MNDNELRKIGEEVGKYLGEGIAGGLSDSSKEATKAFNGFYESLKYQRDFNLISEGEFYEQLEQLRDTYFAEGTDNWVKYTKQIYKYQEKLIKEEEKRAKEAEKKLKAEQKVIEGLYDDISDYATEKLEAILKKQQNLAKNLNSFGSLYNVNTVHLEDFTGHYYSLHDLSWDIEALKRYQRDMKSLKERTDALQIPEEASDYLLSNIKEMDTSDALQFLRALLIKNDQTLSEYVNKAYEKYTLSQSISSEQYSDEFSSGVQDVYDNMKGVLEKAGYEIPDGFSVSGSISAQKFGEAFVLELDNQLAIIRGIIDEFNAGLEIAPNMGGAVYNTTNTSYNISAQNSTDTVEQIRRFETVRRLAGVS